VEVQRRETWSNHTGNQRCEPLQILRPESAEDVVEAVALGEREGVPVRAVGSGHSWSDVALTGGLLLRPEGIAGKLDDDPAQRQPPAPGRLVRAQGGTRIRELNAALWDMELALPNMGGYDGQTIAGVISTSTHGTGVAFGPLADLARSFDVVASEGRLLRIEPAGGVTDPDAYDGPFELRQDDALFRALKTGMGSLGVIVAVTLEVREAFRLTETRTLTTWEDVRAELPDGPTLRTSPHWELLVNPYARAKDGRHTCVITERVPTPAGHEAHGDAAHRPLVNELLSRIPLTHAVINAAIDFDPDVVPEAMDHTLERIVDREFTERSYRVFNIGAANLVPAYSSEIGIEMSGDAPQRAVETVFAVAERHRRVGEAYATAPFSLRFVKGTDAPLSMMQGRDTMMIELILQTDTEGGFELLDDYERALIRQGGRPHWGQVNRLTARDLRALYGDRVDDWLAARAELDRTGVFDSPFSRRVGLDVGE
jgi:L-gulono-1,4-lactone dehydrogenase